MPSRPLWISPFPVLNFTYKNLHFTLRNWLLVLFLVIFNNGGQSRNIWSLSESRYTFVNMWLKQTYIEVVYWFFFFLLELKYKSSCFYLHAHVQSKAPQKLSGFRNIFEFRPKRDTWCFLLDLNKPVSDRTMDFKWFKRIFELKLDKLGPKVSFWAKDAWEF